MKNIQVIDGAENCWYPIYSASDEDFEVVFPGGQDIEFVRDFSRRVSSKIANAVLNRVFASPCIKSEVQGIHGTLFYQLDSKK